MGNSYRVIFDYGAYWIEQCYSGSTYWSRTGPCCKTLEEALQWMQSQVNLPIVIAYGHPYPNLNVSVTFNRV